MGKIVIYHNVDLFEYTLCDFFKLNEFISVNRAILWKYDSAEKVLMIVFLIENHAIK